MLKVLLDVYITGVVLRVMQVPISRNVNMVQTLAQDATKQINIYHTFDMAG